MTTKAISADMIEARDKLRGMLPPGATLYTGLDHVSRSGMSRRISAYVVTDGGITDVSWLIARAGYARLHRHGGIVMGGCGMDMGFALVYGVGRMLYPNGFPCTGSTGYTATYRKAKHPRCMSNAHSNGDSVYRRGKLHKGDSGYALNHRWL